MPAAPSMDRVQKYRLAVVSDLHFGNHKLLGGEEVAGVNRRCAAIARATREAVRIAQTTDDGSDDFIVAGDVFDSSSPSPEVVGTVSDSFNQLAHPALFLVGNHDRSSDQYGHHALAAFNNNRFVTAISGITVTRPAGAVHLVLVPFVENPEGVIEEFLENESELPKVLIFHAGIVVGGGPAWTKEARNTIRVEKLRQWADDFHVIAALGGDWHAHNMVNDRCTGTAPIICQVGSLVQADFGDDPSRVGKLVIIELTFVDGEYYAASAKTLDVPGPRFLTVRLDELKQMARGTWPKIPRIALCQIYLRVEVRGDEEAREAARVLEGDFVRSSDDGTQEKLVIVDWMLSPIVDDSVIGDATPAPAQQVPTEDVVKMWCLKNSSTVAVGERAGEIANRLIRGEA